MHSYSFTTTAATIQVAALVLMVCVSLVALVLVKAKQSNVASVRDSGVFKFLASFDSGSVKVVWVTSQIIVSISWNLDIKFPAPFSSLLTLMSVFSLDFLALECFNTGVSYRLTLTFTIIQLTVIILTQTRLLTMSLFSSLYAFSIKQSLSLLYYVPLTPPVWPCYDV